MCPPDWELALGTKVAVGALGGASGGKQDTFKAESVLAVAAPEC